MVMSSRIFLSMRNISDENRENQNTPFKFNNLPPENRTVHEIMWKNVAQPVRPQMNIWRMRFACWAAKATDTHSEHVTFIAFLL